MAVLENRPPPRWSKKIDQLVLYVALRCRPALQSELAHWIEDSPRFMAFVTTNQDKVRKNLNTSDDEEHRLDVRAELLVAALIAAERQASPRSPRSPCSYSARNASILSSAWMRATYAQ
jgi:hypothetical protein